MRQPESVSDFKSRLALLMRQRETGIQYTVLGARPSHQCLVRKHTGMAHATSGDSGVSGQRTLNKNAPTGNVARPKNSKPTKKGKNQ
jgi:hypothetical protein